MAHDMSSTIQAEIENPLHSTFDSVQEVCFNFMVFELYPQFTQSSMYKSYRGWKLFKFRSLTIFFAETNKTISSPKILELKRSVTYQRLLEFQRIDTIKSDRKELKDIVNRKSEKRLSNLMIV